MIKMKVNYHTSDVNGKLMNTSFVHVHEGSSLIDLLGAIHVDSGGLHNGHSIKINSGIMNAREFLVRKSGWSELVKCN
jgi:hypothetical protein